MPFVPSVFIEFVSVPFDVEDDGGALIEMAGLGLAEGVDFHVYVDDGFDEHLCYSGVAGSGKVVRVLDDGVLRFVVPPMPIGGPYDVLVKNTSEVLQDTISASIQVVPRVWKTKVFDIRRLLPSWYKTGARHVDALDILS